MKVLVTGGAGFIGTSVVRHLLGAGAQVVNLDKLTYAGSNPPLGKLAEGGAYALEIADVADGEALAGIFARHAPDAVMHLAAETHVDRSIDGPEDFIRSNLVGTFRLLEAARAYWQTLPGEARLRFRFHHVSTDEVYGSLGPGDPAFTETTPYTPNSPYAASKAASDHLVRAYHYTYGLPTVTTNCSNNYGPLQFPEKLIPLVILNAVNGKPLPIYGDGLNVRDWLYVGDHCAAVRLALKKGHLGETYNIGGNSEKTNLEVVKTICAILDELRPLRSSPITHYASLIAFIKDRPGHDRRYAIDATKIAAELGWKPAEKFETGLRKTVQWYLAHTDWIESITSGKYREWLDINYANR